jgi:hypothetical protein
MKLLGGWFNAMTESQVVMGLLEATTGSYKSANGCQGAKFPQWCEGYLGTKPLNGNRAIGEKLYSMQSQAKKYRENAK